MTTIRVPLAFRRHCCDCGDELDTRAPGVGEWVEGLAVNREQGGANSITSRRGTGEYVCRNCVAIRRRGDDPLQSSMFE